MLCFKEIKSTATSNIQQFSNNTLNFPYYYIDFNPNYVNHSATLLSIPKS